MIDKKEQGKKNRRKGGEFELKVRKDLESKGWFVSKWMNNVEFIKIDGVEINEGGLKYKVPIRESYSIEKGGEIKHEIEYKNIGKLIPAKRKYNPFSKALSIGTGFPDFIAFRYVHRKSLRGDVFFNKDINFYPEYMVIGVEAKLNGYLDKKERESCKWLLDNKVFSKILIAYMDYPEENMNLLPKERKKKMITYEEFK